MLGGGGRGLVTGPCVIPQRGSGKGWGGRYRNTAEGRVLRAAGPGAPGRPHRCGTLTVGRAALPPAGLSPRLPSHLTFYQGGADLSSRERKFRQGDTLG